VTLSPFLLGGVRGFLLASIPEVEVGQGESFRSNVWKIQVELGSRSFGADLDQGLYIGEQYLKPPIDCDRSPEGYLSCTREGEMNATGSTYFPQARD